MLTVLIVTRNGARTLPVVLETYSHLEAPAGGWKLVIVDNGSTDGTREIVRSFQSRLPLTYLFEPQDGQNLARNAGLGFVVGDLVVFSDDDAFPRPDWLVRLQEAADSQPEFTIFGGAVVPRWEEPPPDWVLNWVRLGPTFTISDSGHKEGPISPGYVFGPNMAIRSQIFSAGHRFDPGIGPRRSGNYAMGSESEMVWRLSKLGAKAWHVHGAVVEHFVRASYMKRSWIIKRAQRFGRGQYRIGQKRDSRSFPSWGGVPRYLFREMVGKIVSILGAVVRGDAQRLFQARWEFRYLYGQAVEARIMNKERRKSS